MRSRILCVAVLVPAVAHADVGVYEEGGMGTAHARGGFEGFEDGGFAVRGAIGYRRGAVGGEVMMSKSDLTLRGEDGFVEGVYSSLTVGPMFTTRVRFGRKVLDRPFEQWFELYGKLGPTHTWMYGDPGDGPPDGTSGFGFAGGGGIRWIYAAVGFSLDITYVHAQLHKDRVHDPRDELGVRDEPAVDLRGGVIATTLGFGFVL